MNSRYSVVANYGPIKYTQTLLEALQYGRKVKWAKRFKSELVDDGGWKKLETEVIVCDLEADKEIPI